MSTVVAILLLSTGIGSVSSTPDRSPGISRSERSDLAAPVNHGQNHLADGDDLAAAAHDDKAHDLEVAAHDHEAHRIESEDSGTEMPVDEYLAFTAERDRTLLRLYLAYFGRDPDVTGLDYWRTRMWDGVSAQTISNAFEASQEFQDRYGHLDDEQFVTLVYRNVMKRTPDVAGREYWTEQLHNGLDRGGLMLGFSESDEYVQKTSDRTAPESLRQFTQEDRRGQVAINRIPYPWEERLPGWTVDFVPERTGFFGLTYIQQKKIVIFVRSSQSDIHLAHVVAHEIGHAVDVSLNDGDDRRRWQQSRGIGGADWWPTRNGADDSSSGAGDFAESFADWQLSSGIFRSRLAGRPDAGDRALMEQLANG